MPRASGGRRFGWSERSAGALRRLLSIAVIVSLAVVPSEPLAAARSEVHALPPADVANGPAGITALAAVLIDAGTGRVLWAKDAEQPRPPASTTKMMTALLALESGRTADVVTVGDRAANTIGSSAHLRSGDRFTLAALITALLMRSGNDAAVAIAEYLAGSVAAFAARMNAKARELGLENTHFVNPHGLTEPFHYSSALDLALIARAALAIPAFAAIVNRAEAKLEGWDARERAVSRSLYNTNRLLVTYDWVDGVKTGTTSAAGNCLVASGTRQGMRLIAVVLHSDDRWGDAVRLLQWGYSHFSLIRLPGTAPVAVPPVPGAAPGAVLRGQVQGSIAVPVSLDELTRMRVTIALRPGLKAPVRRGETVGRERLQLGDVTLLSLPFVARAPVPAASLWTRLWRALR